MSETTVTSEGPIRLRPGGAPLRVAFLGSTVWLDNCAPTAPVQGLLCERFDLGGSAGAEAALDGARAFAPHATVIFDPVALSAQVDRSALSAQAFRSVGGVTLGVLVGTLPRGNGARIAGALDRLVSFDPRLTGATLGQAQVWRAIPPPVSDVLFGEVRPLHRAPRVMSVGRSSAHREAMLMPVKHHHDLLQVLHGISGERLSELLAEHDVGVYVAPEYGGGFGQQVGMHLAAGHLLLADELMPMHGLERNIDYLHIDSSDGLLWVLDRLGRFPEMYQRIRVRGRLKAEQYRASRVFRRLTHDLLADVSAFGGAGIGI